MEFNSHIYFICKELTGINTITHTISQYIFFSNQDLSGVNRFDASVLMVWVWFVLSR